MIRKVDRETRFDEWKSKFVSRPGPWWPGNKFVRSERDWTIEEYLQWCEEQYPLSERNEKIIGELDANPEFKTRVREWRKEFRAKPSELKAMSREEWIEWYFEGWGIFPETWEDVRATCLRLKVTPRWLDFLLSWAFFEDGRAGYVEISDNFADRFWHLPDGLVEASFYVHQYLTQDDLLEGLWPLIKHLKLEMYGQAKRLPPKPADPYKRLLYHLVQFEDKSVPEIHQIFMDVLDEEPLDDSIKRAFPEESEERLTALVQHMLEGGWEKSEMRALIWRLDKRFGLRLVEARYPPGEQSRDRDAIELYKLRRERYHY